MKDIFDNLIYSLNQVEVHGKRNLDILLGCIQTLEQLKGMVKTTTETVEAEEGNGNDHHDEPGAGV